MLTQPAELTDAALAAQLAQHWAIAVDQIEYRAVGFGSHHWSATGGNQQWFVTVDDLDAKLRADDDTRPAAYARLRSALSTAHALHRLGLSFVVAPMPATDGDVLTLIDDRFAAAVYPHIDGTARSWGPYESRAERVAVIEMLASLHDAPASASQHAGIDDFALQNRDDLEAAMDAGSTWGAGPYARQATQLFARHAGAIGRLLVEHDRLATHAAQQPERAVLTHGEPHIGNTMVTDDGLVLVDWDTAMSAPPERDLWMVAKDDPSVVDDYTALTGRAVDAAVLEMYRITWDLADMGVYAALFRRPHDDTDDLRQSMTNLRGLLDALE